MEPRGYEPWIKERHTLIHEGSAAQIASENPWFAVQSKNREQHLYADFGLAF